jgi:hypothetical protein
LHMLNSWASQHTQTSHYGLDMKCSHKGSCGEGLVHSW